MLPQPDAEPEEALCPMPRMRSRLPDAEPEDANDRRGARPRRPAALAEGEDERGLWRQPMIQANETSGSALEHKWPRQHIYTLVPLPPTKAYVITNYQL